MTKVLSYCILAIAATLASCSKPDRPAAEEFTRADSLTENYLNLQDSMLRAWNILMRNEKEKTKAMDELVRLIESTGADAEDLEVLKQRIQQLENIRFTQKALSNPHVIDEYDFASGSIISELLSLTEVNPHAINDPRIYELVDRIKRTDQSVPIYRHEYDRVVSKFNAFMEQHHGALQEIDAEIENTAMPLFQSASEKN